MKTPNPALQQQEQPKNEPITPEIARLVDEIERLRASEGRLLEAAECALSEGSSSMVSIKTLRQLREAIDAARREKK